MILVLCMTTLRLRELLNRRWDEVHLDGPAPFISVPHTKTGVPKKVPLPKVAVEALKALPSYEVDDYVFPSRATARWPEPRKPYRWDMGKPFRTLVRSLGLGGPASPRPAAHRAVGAADAGHPRRRGPEDHGAPLTRAGAVPAPLARVQGPDGGPDRPGALRY